MTDKKTTVKKSKNPLIFIVEDSSVNVNILKDILSTIACTIKVASDGEKALKMLETINPDLILLDVILPKLNGINICRLIKGDKKFSNTPVIFLTALSKLDDIVEGLEAGAVDYVIKPFLGPELIARVKTHLKLKSVIDRENELINELENNLSKIKQLSGLLPICASCKKIRDGKGYWQKVEKYISEHSEALFSHGLCPECIEKLYSENK